MITPKDALELRHTEYNSDPVVMEMLDTIEALRKENEHLKMMEHLRVMEITRLNNDVTRLDHEGFILRARITTLEAVAAEAEGLTTANGFVEGTATYAALPLWLITRVKDLARALAALREGKTG